jgi:hypothetical protein
MVDLGEVAELTGMSGPMLRDRAEGGKCHLHQGQDGAPLVCLESLLNSM